jgi:5'-nucleotidase
VPRILVTNDDGIYSEGLRKLADACRAIGEVIIVAPDREQSAASHALTLNRPLRLLQIEKDEWIVDGTPTDCVNLACAILLKGQLPDLVVSGINKGWNLGDDITYSGTVSGALEGALLGTPGIAVSVKRTRTYDFAPSADAAQKVAAMVLKHGLPARSFININVPSGTPKGLRITTQAKRNHVTKIDARTDPRGNDYYWIEEALDEYHPDSGRSDHEAVKEGYVSVTPLQPDMTAYDVLNQLATQLK